MNKLSVLLLLSILPTTQSALAHYPVMDCYKKKGAIHCEVGFSDGTKASGKQVKLITYDEDVLAVKTVGKFSRVVFQEPEGEYYLYFDAKHEFPIEVDYGEL